MTKYYWAIVFGMVMTCMFFPQAAIADDFDETIIQASDATDYNLFGSSVSIFENYAIVGDDFDVDNGRLSGAAYVFERSAVYIFSIYR